MDIKVDVHLLLEEIAEKLGIATEYVYPLMYRQAMIDGFWYLFWSMVCILILYVVVRVSIEIARKIRDPQDLSDADDFMPAFFILPSVSIVVIAALLATAKAAINALLNTDWYIIQQVINQLAKGG